MLPELHILAYCEEMIPILAEIALDCGYAPRFQIIENMEVEKGHSRIDVPGVHFDLVRKTDWAISGGEKVAFSVVQPVSKQKVFQEFQQFGDFQREYYPDLIHPTCFVSRTVSTSGGLIMEPLSVISSHTTIGFGVNIRRGVNIGHHGIIGDFVSINPGANIGGKVRIGDRVTIGIGAVLLDGIEIGADSFIGAGSVVTRSIPPGVVAYGSPCKVVREVASK
ncbi:MAG: UDP-3-O-(3-hydroxymyristoyl)glucosamine N-acyltransferase [Saprospiraceae bacterium]|nr:UDP-3-O-(3-hydroxymyristoyl)glucosamine N-acyltransferase [Saprospiraceae bacterium]